MQNRRNRRSEARKPIPRFNPSLVGQRFDSLPSAMNAIREADRVSARSISRLT